MVVMVVRAAFAILAIFFNALPKMPMVATMEDKTPWKMKTETFFLEHQILNILLSYYK